MYCTCDAGSVVNDPVLVNTDAANLDCHERELQK